MISLHHAHLMASDVDETIAFWRDAFDGEVMLDIPFAGARNVLIAVGSGHIHLYEQPPKVVGQGTVHHLGVQVDDLEGVVERVRNLGVSVTDIRNEFFARYAMAKGPDDLLIEIFEPRAETVPSQLRGYFGLPEDDQ